MEKMSKVQAQAAQLPHRAGQQVLAAGEGPGQGRVHTLPARNSTSIFTNSIPRTTKIIPLDVHGLVVGCGSAVRQAADGSVPPAHGEQPPEVPQPQLALRL